MEKNNKYELYDIFFEELRKSNDYIAVVYLNLFGIKSRKDLERELQYTYTVQQGKDEHWGKEGKEAWFTAFHKSIRQADYFYDCYKKAEYKLLSKEEESEFRFLRSQYSMKKLDKHSKTEGKMFTDQYRRYLDLREKQRRETIEVNIGGELDSTLWHMVHVDRDSVLFNALEDSFYFYSKTQKPKKRKATSRAN